MKNIAASILFLLALPAAAHAADAPDLLARLEGAWLSRGDAFGAPAVSRMHWSTTLDGKFMRLEYRIEMAPKDRPAGVFEGVAFYELGSGAAAFWADNSGDLHPVRTETDGDALIAHWGVEGGKQGRTRYEIRADGAVIVTDWILANGAWRQFNANTFHRDGAH